ncbi:MAG: hypothetical protein PHH01_02195 [Patescibacteria group bacterium]|nr:hypothetical protein [Patescibacteria group bacterium]
MLWLKIVSALWWVIQRYIFGHPKLFEKHLAREQSKLAGLPPTVWLGGIWISLLKTYRYVIAPPRTQLPTPVMIVQKEGVLQARYFIRAPGVGTFWHLREQAIRPRPYEGVVYRFGNVIGVMVALNLEWQIKLDAVWRLTGSEDNPRYLKVEGFSAVRIISVLTPNEGIIEWGQSLFEVALVDETSPPALSAP